MAYIFTTKVRITEREPSSLFDNPSQLKIENDDNSSWINKQSDRPCCLIAETVFGDYKHAEQLPPQNTRN